MFWDIFVKLCNEKGEKPNPVAQKLKISSGAVTRWKNGATPQSTTLQKIADYFGVSVEYLVGTTKEAPNLGAVYDKTIHMIPVYETVSAGFGVMAQDYIVDYQPFAMSSQTEANESLFIRVKGDSMYPKIEDGDLILVHKQNSVDSNSIAVVLVDDTEGFVKRVLYGEDWIELHSINPEYKPHRFEGRDVLRVRVIGLVTKIIKNA